VVMVNSQLPGIMRSAASSNEGAAIRQQAAVAPSNERKGDEVGFIAAV
jgi:hypothetical protein